MQEHRSAVDEEILKLQDPITYVSGLLQGSHLMGSLLPKKHIQYTWQLKSNFYLADTVITL